MGGISFIFSSFRGDHIIVAVMLVRDTERVLKSFEVFDSCWWEERVGVWARGGGSGRSVLLYLLGSLSSFISCYQKLHFSLCTEHFMLPILIISKESSESNIFFITGALMVEIYTFQVLLQRRCWRLCKIYQWDYSRWPSYSCWLWLGVSGRQTMGTWAEWWAGEAFNLFFLFLFLLANAMFDLIHTQFFRCGMNIVQTMTQISFACHFSKLSLFVQHFIRT